MSTRTGGERRWPEVRCELGESLLWDERSAAFWWVDVHRGALYRAAPGGGAVEVSRFDEALGHVALTEDQQKAWL